MKFGNTVRVETSRYLTKMTTLRRSRRFLQPSIQLRYNYYVQLVATKRDWMRVPNLKFWSARTCVRYNHYVQLVATKRDWMRVPNVKFWSTAEGRGGSWS